MQSFLDWYVRTKQEANITRLAQAGLPPGRGRKDGVPKRKHSRTPVASPDIVFPRAATSQPAAKRSILSSPSSESISFVGSNLSGSNVSVSQQNMPVPCPTSQPSLLAAG